MTKPLHISEHMAADRLARIVELGKLMRKHEVDYYYYKVGIAGPKMRKAQREFDALLKLETEFINSKQPELL